MIRLVRLAAGGVALLGSATAVLAQSADDGSPVPPMKTIGQTSTPKIVPSLAVINATGAKLDGTTLTLTGVATSTIVFADRPVRAAGHMTTEQFVMQWDPDKNNFAIDPPNATISVLGGDGSKVSDAVVTLKTAKLNGNDLQFDVAVLEGSLNGTAGSAALFIDRFGGGFHAGGFHMAGPDGFHASGFHAGGFHGGDWGGYHGDDWHGGTYWHAPVYHGAWYGVGAGAAAGAAVGLAAGTAIGAAAAAPYYYGGSYDGRCGYYPYPPCY